MTFLQLINKRYTKIMGILVSVITVLSITALILLIILGSGVRTSCEKNTPPTEDNGNSDDVTPTQGNFDSVILPETPHAGQDYINSLTFLGDSTTAHMRNRGGLRGGLETTQVWAGDNNTLTLGSETAKAFVSTVRGGNTKSISDTAAETKPSILIITLGINGCAYLNHDQFTAAYGKLIDTILTASPSTKIVLQSIFPITSDCKTSGLSNPKINTCNEWVKEIAQTKGLKYLDTASVLKDKNGALKKEYDNSGDGIHLTAEAYSKILDYIATHKL